MDNKQTNKDEVYYYSKQRFEIKNASQSKRHPMISSMRIKADERYLNIIKKYFNPPNIQAYSIFSFSGISMHSKLLYKADKFYSQIKDYLSIKKIKADQFAIMSNIHLEEYLGKLNRSSRNDQMNIKKQNFFIKHLTIGLKALVMIKPDESNILLSSQDKSYSIQPMIYSTLTSNIYHSIIKSLGLSNMNTKHKCAFFLLNSLSFGLMYSRYQTYKANDEKRREYEKNYTDIIMHTERYNKIFDIYSTQEDQKYLKYCKDEIASNQMKINQYRNNKTIIKLLVPFGLFSYLIYNSALGHHFIKKVGIGMLVINELFIYFSLTQRAMQRRMLLNPKLQFFKENVVHSYDIKQ